MYIISNVFYFTQNETKVNKFVVKQNAKFKT